MKKQAPYLTLIKSDMPTSRFGEVDLYLNYERFTTDDEQDLYHDKIDGYTIVTASGYLLFERASASTYRFIGFTTVTPKKVGKNYVVFNNEGIYGRLIQR